MLIVYDFASLIYKNVNIRNRYLIKGTLKSSAFYQRFDYCYVIFLIQFENKSSGLIVYDLKINYFHKPYWIGEQILKIEVNNDNFDVYLMTATKLFRVKLSDLIENNGIYSV